MNVTAYLEYGLSERLTLIMNLPVKTLTSKRTEIIGGGIVARHVTIHTQGLADLSISVRYALLNGPFVLSYQTGIKLPLGYEEGPADDGPPLGTSKIDFEGHLLIGKSLFSLPAYLTASVGFRRPVAFCMIKFFLQQKVAIFSARHWPKLLLTLSKAPSPLRISLASQ